MKQAKIKCPHCGEGFTVRQVDDEPDLERATRIHAAAQEAMKTIDAAMDKAFGALRSIWKS